MIETTLFWIGLIGAVGIGFVYFRDLGDISQMVMKVERANTLRFIRNEYKLVAVGLAAAALMIAAHLFMDAGPGWAFWTAIIVCLLFYGFTYVWVHLALRNQVNSAKYFSISDAVAYINPSSSVLVIENNGVARAHSDRELMQPHLAGDQEGLDGENVVMTYCSMANLGIGYKPEIEGKSVPLTVMAQHGNNLILRDDSSNEPIQHIYGYREHGGASGPGMTPWPTFRMSFSGFQKAYPDGKVFLNKPSRNPLVWLFDFATGLTLSGGIEIQHRANAPLMDNMSNEDDRLPNKTYVWGMNIGDDAVCYTRDFVVEQGGLINTSIGGRAIVISWDALYDSIGAYYNDTDTPITEIDFFGKTPQGVLPRVEALKPGLFWHVWVEFFPKTDINRA